MHSVFIKSSCGLALQPVLLCSPAPLHPHPLCVLSVHSCVCRCLLRLAAGSGSPSDTQQQHNNSNSTKPLSLGSRISSCCRSDRWFLSCGADGNTGATSRTLLKRLQTRTQSMTGSSGTVRTVHQATLLCCAVLTCTPGTSRPRAATSVATNTPWGDALNLHGVKKKGGAVEGD